MIGSVLLWAGLFGVAVLTLLVVLELARASRPPLPPVTMLYPRSSCVRLVRDDEAIAG